MITMILMAIIAPMAAMLTRWPFPAAGNLPPTRQGRGSSMRTPAGQRPSETGGYNKQLPMQVNPATAQMYIVNSAYGRRDYQALQHPSPDSGTRGPADGLEGSGFDVKAFSLTPTSALPVQGEGNSLLPNMFPLAKNVEGVSLSHWQLANRI